MQKPHVCLIFFLGKSTIESCSIDFLVFITCATSFFVCLLVRMKIYFMISKVCALMPFIVIFCDDVCESERSFGDNLINYFLCGNIEKNAVKVRQLSFLPLFFGKHPHTAKVFMVMYQINELANIFLLLWWLIKRNSRSAKTNLFDVSTILNEAVNDTQDMSKWVGQKMGIFFFVGYTMLF